MQQNLEKAFQSKPELEIRTLTVSLHSQRLVFTGMWSWEMHSHAVYCSDVMDFPPQFEGTKGIIHPDDREQLAELAALPADKVLSHIRFRIITTYGEVKTITGRRITIQTNGHNPAPQEKESWETAVQLMVLQKEAALLRLHKLLYDAGEKLLGNGTWYNNKETGVVWYSDAVYRIHGLAPESLNAHAHTFYPFIHPDDREIVTEAFEQAFAAEVPLHIVYRIMQPGGALRQVRQTTDWIFNAEGQRVFTGVLQDVTEMWNLAQELESAGAGWKLQQQMAQFAEKETRAGYWAMNLATRKSFFSPNYIRLHGIKPPFAPSHKTFFDLAHPEDRAQVQGLLQTIYEGHALPETGYRIIRPDGKLRHLRLSATLMAQQGGEQMLLGVIADVTLQKTLEEKVRELTGTLALQTITTDAAEGTAAIGSVIWFANGGMYWSEGFYRMLGHRPRSVEPAQSVWQKNVHPDDLKNFTPAIVQAQQQQLPEDLQFRLLTKSGIRRMQLTFRAVSHENNTAVLGLLQDINLQAGLQQQLKEKERYAALVENAGKDMLLLTNAENVIISWNRGAEHKTGIKRDDALYRNLYEVFPALHHPAYMAHIKTVQGGAEVAVKKCSNHYFLKPHSYLLLPFRSDAGDMPGVLHLVRDVSQEMELQQQLSERLRFIEKLLDATVDRIVVLDDQMNYLYWNPKAEAYYGLQKEKVLGKNILEVFPAFRNDPSYQEFRRALKGEIVYLPAAAPEEGREYFETYLIPILGDEGSVNAVLWIVHDLSKEQQLQHERQEHWHQLQEEHRRLKEAQSLGLIGSFEWTVGEEFVVWSNEMYRLNHIKPGTPIAALTTNQWIHPDDEERLLALKKESVQKPGIYQTEHRIVLHDGTEKYVFHRFESVADESGAVYRVHGTIQDITERIKAQEDLNAKQELLQATMDSSPEMINVFKAVRDEQGEIVDFVWILNNHAAEKVFGNVIGKQLVQNNPGVIEEGIFDTFKKVVETGIPDQQERYYAHEQFNGWFIQTAVKMDDGVVTTTLDITERKKAEQEVQRSRAFLQNVIDAPRIGMTVYRAVRNEDGEIVDFIHEYINQASIEMLGGEDFTGRLFTDHGENAVLQIPQLTEVIETGKGNSYTREAELLGRKLWFAITNTPLDSERLVHTWQDVTDRKAAELEIRQSKELIQTVFDVSLNPIAYHKAVRDESGAIVDFEFVLENSQARQYATENRKGKRYSEAYPGIKKTIVFKLYCDVVEKGLELNTEVQLELNGRGRWFQLMGVKLGDGLVATAVDITERKASVAEILRLKDEVAQKATDKYQALFKTIDEGFSIHEVVTDEAGNVIDVIYREVNAAFEQLTGMQDVLGKKASEFLPHLEQTWLDALTQVCKTGKPLRGENYTADLDRWITYQYSRIGEAGSPLIAVVFNDITERKQREQQQEFLLKFSDALRTKANADAISYCALQLLTEQLGLDRCYIGVYRLADNRADLTHQVGNDRVPPMPQWIHLSDFPEALKITFGGTLVVEDVLNKKGLTDTDRQNMAAFGFGAIVAASLRKGAHNPQWVMVAVSATPRQWTDSEIRLIEEVTERTWAAVERAKAEEALRQSEEKYRTLFESIDEGFVIQELVYDDSGKPVDVRLLEANPAHQKLTGLQNAVGKTSSELALNTEGYWFEKYDQVVKTGEPLRFENWHGPTQRWYDVFLSKMGEAGSTTMAMVFNDITERKKTELQLKENYEQIQLATKAAKAGWGYRNFVTGEAYWDEQGQKILGFPNEEDAHTVEGWEKRIHPDDLIKVEALMAESISGDKPFDLEYRVIRADGETRFIHAMGTFAKDADGTLLKGGGLVIDITGRKNTEKKQAFLLRLSDTLRPLNDSFMIQQIAAKELLHEINAGWVYYVSVGKDEDTISAMEGCSKIEPFVLSDGARLSHFGTAIVPDHKNGKTLIYNNTQSEPHFNESNRQYYKMINATAYISVPLIKEKRLIALLSVGNPTARKWTAAEVALVEEVAQRTWAAVEKAKTEEALRESQNRFYSIANIVPDLLWDSEPDGATNWYNDRWLAYTGQSPEQAVGWGWVAAIHPDDRATSAGRYEAAVKAGEPLRQEHRIRRHDGVYRWFVVSTVPVKNEKGVVVKMYGAATDIHDHKLVEEQLKDFASNLEQQVAQRTEELQKNLRILKHSEELAQIGSWEYIIADEAFHWSDGMYELFRLPAGAKVTPEVYINYAAEGDRSVARRIVKNIRKGHKPFDETIRIVANGAKRLFRIKASVVTDKKGRPEKIVGVDLDITDLKAAEEKAAETQLWLEKTAAASPDSISVYDLHHKQPVYLNSCLAQWMHLTNEELIRMGIRGRLEMVHPDDRQPLLQLNEKAKNIEDGQTLTLEYRLHAKNNKTVWIRNRTKVFQRDADGRVTHLLSVLQDITEEKAAAGLLTSLNQSLQKKNKELESKNEEITSFAFVASHDLKEPIRKIHTFTDILLHKESIKLSDSSRDLLNRIAGAVSHLSHLIHDIQELAHIHAEDTRFEALELTEAVHRVLANLAEEIKGSGARVSVSPMPAVRAISSQVFYLLKNLIGNALKFQPPGNIPYIKVWAENITSAGNEEIDLPVAYLKLAVQDNGIGFDAQYKDKVFRIFQRLHTREAYAGTGIGLAICRKVMENHRGFMDVHSEPGKGSIFYCYFPL